MIDLSYKPKKQEEKEKELPLIAQLFLLSPFAIMLYIVLATSFIHGIY